MTGEFFPLASLPQNALRLAPRAAPGAAKSGNKASQGTGFMKIVSFVDGGGLRLGVVEGDNVIDLQAADPAAPADLGDWLRRSNGDLKPLADLAGKAPACRAPAARRA